MSVPGWTFKSDPPADLPELIDWLAIRVGWIRNFFHAKPRSFDDRLRAEIVQEFGLTDPGGDGGMALLGSNPNRTTTFPADKVMHYALLIANNVQFWLDHHAISGHPIWTDNRWLDPRAPDRPTTLLDLGVHFSLLLSFLREQAKGGGGRPNDASAVTGKHDSDASSVIIRNAVEAARNSWMDGYAIIVANINAVLSEKELGLQIAANRPRAGATLLDCRRRLGQALRDIPFRISNLPDADSENWCPWSVGYINDRTNKPVSIGVNYASALGDTLNQTIEFLRQKTKDWPWHDNLVSPIEQDAIQANQAFDAMLARVASIHRQAADTAPTVKPDGPESPNRFNWKDKSCELTPIPWRLVGLLWDPKSLPEDDACERLWPDTTRTMGALKSAVSRANEAFVKARIPVTLSRKNGFVVLSVSDGG